jgi:hypothetical protein
MFACIQDSVLWMQGAGLGESNNAKQRLRVQLQDPRRPSKQLKAS